MSRSRNTASVETTASTADEAQQRNICVTCRHAERCLFLRAAHQPIWTCEEFDEHAGPSNAAGQSGTSI